MTSQFSFSSLSTTAIPDQNFEAATVTGSGMMLFPLDGLIYSQELGPNPGTQVGDIYTRDMGMSGKYALFNSFEDTGVDVFTISSQDGSNFGIASLDLSTQLYGWINPGRVGASVFRIEGLSDGNVVATAQIDAQMSASGGGITYTLQTTNPYLIAGGRITFDPSAGWGNIDSIRITGQGGEFATIALDNLDIQPVPPPPVVTGVSASTADGGYKVGDVVTITVTYSSTVIVAGTPTLTLETGTVDRPATYVSGSGSNTLTFHYTIQAGDSSPDLDYLNANALSVNGGTIRDIYRNDASLTLPPSGTTGSLGWSKAIVVDGVAPAVTQVTVNGDKIVIPYTEAIRGSNAGWTDAFKVLVDGVFTGIQAVVIDGNKVAITLAAAVKHSQLVQVNYVSMGGTVQDAVGNDAPDGTFHPALNLTPQPPTPVIKSVAIADGDFAVGEQVTATITVAADADIYTLVTGRIGGYELSGLTKVDDATYTAVFTVTEGGESFARGQSIPVNLTVKGSADNQSAGYTAAVTQSHGTIDTVRPVVHSAAISGDRIVITCSEALDAAGGANALASGFSVKVDGQTVAIAGRAFGPDGKTIVLTLAAPVIKGQSVSVSYRDPSPADDGDAIQDVAGNDAASFTDVPVLNTSGSKVVDGIDVLSSVITNPDGSRTHVIQTGTVQPGRVDVTGPSGYADIPLSGLDNVQAILAQLGDGSSLDARITRAELMAVLLRALNIEIGSVGTPTFTDVTGEWASAYIASAAALGIQSNVVGIDLSGLPFRDTVLTGSSAYSNLMVLNASQDGIQRKVEINDVGFIVLKGSADIYGGDGAQFIVGDSASQRIVMGADDDTLHGGAGDDYVGSHGGNDWLYGDEGNDTVSGGEGHDWLFGGDGHDWLYGGSGHDRLDGGAGNDHLHGESGHDTLSGGTGHDGLWGGSGHDRLDGGAGHDSLWGGAGNDRLTGGLGRDKLWGGAGKDVFVFTAVKDSPAGAQRDGIQDFQSGRDTIDLRGLDANTRLKGNQAFTWASQDVPFLLPQESASVLQAGFTGKAGQLRYDHGLLMGDVNGDGRADFAIKIVGKFAFGDVLL